MSLYAFTTSKHLIDVNVSRSSGGPVVYHMELVTMGNATRLSTTLPLHDTSWSSHSTKEKGCIWSGLHIQCGLMCFKWTFLPALVFPGRTCTLFSSC